MCSCTYKTNQPRFRRGYYSTVTVSPKINDDVNVIAVVVLLDMSKALDGVSHDLSISKLTYYRIEIVVKSGVTQRSILDPIIFNIFVPDLSSAVVYCNLHTYADEV